MRSFDYLQLNFTVHMKSLGQFDSAFDLSILYAAALRPWHTYIHK
jgi:hypothetical protein